MRKTIILFLTILLFTSCYPVKEVFSDTYKVENEVNFKVLKYSEPTTKGNFIRSNEAKYVDLKITMTNESSGAKEVDFTNFSIVNDKNDIRSSLWKVNKNIELAGTENTSVKFEPFETKKLWLCFLAPKNDQIKYLIYNGKKVELKFGKTKQAMF